jgi:phosphate transport system protein
VALTIADLERLKSIVGHMSMNIRRVMQATERLMQVSDVNERRRLWREIEDTALILDKIRRDFVNEVLTFIARRQPLGRELVATHVLISIAYDVYRISRYCREMARIDSMLAPSSGVNAIQGVLEMFREAEEAVNAALEDLTEFTPKRADVINRVDQHIDEEYRRLLQEIANSVTVSREKAFKALIMRHIERIVDHAQYIEQYLSELL